MIWYFNQGTETRKIREESKLTIKYSMNHKYTSYRKCTIEVNHNFRHELKNSYLNIEQIYIDNPPYS